MISQRIEAFLEEYLMKADKYLTREQFENLRESLIKNLEEKPKNLYDEALR